MSSSNKIYLLPVVKAVHSGVPFSHQKVSNINASEFGAMQQQMSSFMKTCDKLEMTLHVDVWTDPWERHWFGAIVQLQNGLMKLACVRVE